MKRLLAPFSISLLCVCGIAAQNQPQQANSDQSSSTIRSTAQEVLLDMVFRDKKGKTIRDVRPEEIHILEDGVEQNLTSFSWTLVYPEVGAACAEGLAQALVDP